jgi:glycosyltransferase involved in cell wall biosynthesis
MQCVSIRDYRLITRSSLILRRQSYLCSGKKIVALSFMETLLYQPFFWILVAVFVAQLYIYLVIYRRLAAYKAKTADYSPTPPVSVIIAARNEADNIRQFLPLILAQDYPEFEVIVINDQSWDKTGKRLEKMALESPKLRVVTIDEHVNEFAGKKLALTLGAKAAAHEILVFTDADCEPASDQWLRQMAGAYEGDRTEIVLGYSPYRNAGGFLNKFIRFETFITALQYFSFAIGGNPYMGVGRNLSYRKSLFFRNKGFAPYLKVPAGDDDLFVNLHANKQNTALALNKESFVYSESKKTWSDWYRQKRRHLSVGKYYKKKHRRALSYLWLFNFLFYAVFIASIFLVKPFWIPLIAFGLRLILQYTAGYFNMRKLASDDLLPLYPVLDFLYQVIYLPFIGLVTLFRRRKKERW